MTTTAANVRQERVRERLARLAGIGRRSSGGVTRLAYSAPEREAHELFARWAREDGATVEVDAAGNSIATFRPGRPYFLLGSHLDTVVDGGNFDGTVGVICGIEAASAVAGSDEIPVGTGIRVVAFAGEEGARFGRPNLGAGFAAGLLTETDARALHDADDIPLADAAAALELAPSACEPWVDGEIACFVEVHIEQGRQLETGAARIGLVDAIAGSVRLLFEITGRADHSGATPMELRRDALAGAAELTLEVERAGRSYRSTVATVGKLLVEPNNVTTVASGVRLWVDIRDVDADRQRAAARAVLAAAARIEHERGIEVRPRVISDQEPVVLVAWLRELAHAECRAQEIPYRVLSSGAGHDAAVVARRAPSAMVFIPCRDGVSHSPREHADAEDVATAAALLVGVLRRGLQSSISHIPDEVRHGSPA